MAKLSSQSQSERTQGITSFRGNNLDQLENGVVVPIDNKRIFSVRAVFDRVSKPFYKVLSTGSTQNNPLYDLKDYHYKFTPDRQLARLNIRYHLPFSGGDESYEYIRLGLVFDGKEIGYFTHRNFSNNYAQQKDIYLEGTVYNVSRKPHEIAIYATTDKGLLHINDYWHGFNTGSDKKGNPSVVSLDLQGEILNTK